MLDNLSQSASCKDVFKNENKINKLDLSPNENTIYGFCTISGKPFHKGHDNLIMSALNILKTKATKENKNYILYIYVSTKSRIQQKQFPILGHSMEVIYKDIIKPHYDNIDNISFNISGNPGLDSVTKMQSILETLVNNIDLDINIDVVEKENRLCSVINNIKFFYGTENNDNKEDLKKFETLFNSVKVRINSTINNDDILFDVEGFKYIYWNMYKNEISISRSYTDNISGTKVRRILDDLLFLKQNNNNDLRCENIKFKEEEIFEALPNFLSNNDKRIILNTLLEYSVHVNKYNKFINLGGEKEENKEIRNNFINLLLINEDTNIVFNVLKNKKNINKSSL